jgi:multicomponent Na+:H+ antiporter subunit B
MHRGIKKTDILELAGRKLAPFMFLFGLYLVSYGDVSPGGGFQGGAVIASGVILLSMTHGVGFTRQLFPVKGLSLTEAAAFGLLIATGVVGLVAGAGFLADFLSPSEEAFVLPEARFIYLLNVLIGVKVAAGISLICLHLFGEDT